MARLEALGEAASGEEVERLAALRAACGYAVDETCAADGLCATQCPVGINTGDLVRELRHERLASRAGLAHRVGRHFSGVTRMARGALSVAGAANRVLGDDLMEKASGSARRLSGGCLPQWTPALPQAAPIRVLRRDRKSTRLNSSHVRISYAVFCLKKKKRFLHRSAIVRCARPAP